MGAPLHAKQSPDLPALFEILDAHSLRYVVTGSVAALLYGVELEPGDFDITPALDQDNLQRLVSILTEIEATPESLGHWETKPDGEKRWVEDDVTAEALANWQPDLMNISTFDYLFHKCHGNFDIVPELAGGYEALRQGAVRKSAFGYEVWIAHVADVLAKLTIPRREKDVSRVQELRRIQRSLRLRAERTDCLN
jgi:hypothetical protein